MEDGVNQKNATRPDWHWIAGALGALLVVGLLSLIPPKPGTPMPGIGNVDSRAELTLKWYDVGRGEPMLVPNGFRTAFVETLQSTGRYVDIRELTAAATAGFELKGVEYLLYHNFILERGDDVKRGRGWEFDWRERGQIALDGRAWTSSREDWIALFESYETEANR